MAFYFPNFIEYNDHPQQDKVNLPSWEVGKYFLEHATSVSDLKVLARQVNVLNTIYKQWNIVLPLHWFAADKTGACVTIEVVKGEMRVYDNKVRVNTNAPTFPEHLETLKHYQDLSPIDKPNSISLGSGAVGLPGDFTSKSRFVRLNFFNKYHNKPKDVHEGVNIAFHILNNFDIVKGYSIDPKNGSEDYTQYTVVYDLGGFQGFGKTYMDQQVRSIRSYPIPNQVGFSNDEIKIILIIFLVVFLGYALSRRRR
jgi:choloylglycine hydrolase